MFFCEFWDARDEGCYSIATSKILVPSHFKLFLWFNNLFSRCGGGGGRAAPKIHSLKEVGLRTWWKMFVVALEIMLPHWFSGIGGCWKRRGRASQQAEVRWDRSDIQSRKPFRNILHQSLASGGWNTCLRFVHHLVRVVTMLWTLASLA